MKHYQRDGIDFVTDLVWQHPIPGEKFNLKKYREDCAFDFYCKTNKLGNTYGFGRYPRDEDGKIILKLKKPVSLGLYIIESVDIEAEKDVNLFVCFCFDNSLDIPSYGYVFIYNGTILPEDGEFIGSLDEVKARIKQLTKLYNGKAAFVPDDVPFYDDMSFEFETGLQIYKISSTHDEHTGAFISASENVFWQKDRRKSSVSSLRNLDNTKQKRLIVLLAGLVIASGLTYGIKEYFFPDISFDDVDDVAHSAPTSYPAKVFIDACLAQANYIVNSYTWQTVSYTCNLKGINVQYRNDGGSPAQLEQLIGKKVKLTKNGETIALPIKLPEVSTPIVSKTPLANPAENLQLMADKLGFVVTINGNKVNINSGYSPIWLYNNGVIHEFNLSEISVSPEATGFMNWKISGEINAN